jgi:hypothetical protein
VRWRFGSDSTHVRFVSQVSDRERAHRRNQPHLYDVGHQCRGFERPASPRSADRGGQSGATRVENTKLLDPQYRPPAAREERLAPDRQDADHHTTTVDRQVQGLPPCIAAGGHRIEDLSSGTSASEAPVTLSLWIPPTVEMCHLPRIQQALISSTGQKGLRRPRTPVGVGPPPGRGTSLGTSRNGASCGSRRRWIALARVRQEAFGSRQGRANIRLPIPLGRQAKSGTYPAPSNRRRASRRPRPCFIARTTHRRKRQSMIASSSTPT